MKLEPAFEEHAPFLLLGILCWLCGAVFVGVAAAWLVNETVGAAAASLLTVLVLIGFWRLGSLTTFRIN